MESDQEADDFQRGWDEEGNESEGADEDAVNEDEDDEEVFLRGNVLTGHAEGDFVDAGRSSFLTCIAAWSPCSCSQGTVSGRGL